MVDPNSNISIEGLNILEPYFRQIYNISINSVKVEHVLELWRYDDSRDIKNEAELINRLEQLFFILSMNNDTIFYAIFKRNSNELQFISLIKNPIANILSNEIRQLQENRNVNFPEIYIIDFPSYHLYALWAASQTSDRFLPQSEDRFVLTSSPIEEDISSYQSQDDLLQHIKTFAKFNTLK